ncbi:ABC transporter permease/substrate-binding protein [Shouchella shacheensis]|uniref:ABC transporter permease/substrate-binding protein n=1 Tax=Shouchella shacheensis TaxID=1649580 RepID=UPI0007404F7B|nr:ABC transporter permease/substrate-binding protein [Shouchella shacheensis]
MNEFWGAYIDLFQNRSDLLFESLWQHLQLSLISLLMAVFIAVPLGILLTRKQKAAEWVIGVAAVLQTIPSLALLGFLILFVGIGTTPAIIALTAYALLPILRNTYTGIKGVDAHIVEAADGMGMNTYRRLIKVELPLAMPTMMAGVRTSMVLIVGTATLAALVGGGGLGDLIMTGIQRSSNEYIVFGALPAALLALLFDFVLRFTEKKTNGTSFKPILSVILLALLVVVTPALIPQASESDLSIGGKREAEASIVANMYKLLIEQDTDLEVEVLAPLGETDVNFNALQVGDIDMYPEFSGTILADLLSIDEFSYEERESYEQARDLIEDEHGFIYLEPMAYQNTNAIAVPRELAEENDIQTISDLRQVADEWRAGFTFEFMDREDGYAGFEGAYGFELENVESMDLSAGYRAIESGDLELVDVFSTDPQLVENDMIVLEDDETLFPPYQGAPLVRDATLSQHPELEEILNQLGGRVTEEEITELNYRVDIEDENPYDVAEEFLLEQGLLND